MKEMKAEQQEVFEDLTKEERRSLRKEFREIVEPRFKMLFWSGIILLLLAIISGGFSIYFLINIFFAGVVAFQLYICAAIFTIGCIVSLLLTSKYHKRFRTWLKENKNIGTRIISNTK